MTLSDKRQRLLAYAPLIARCSTEVCLMCLILIVFEF